MKRHSRLVVWSATFVAAVTILGGCQKAATTSDTTSTAENGQQIGDQMSGIDAGASGGGARSEEEGVRRLFARLSPSEVDSFTNESDRASCLTLTLGACSSNKRILDFANCTLLGATFAGTNTFTFSDPMCVVDAGQTVARDPDFTVTGRFGGTFTVKKTGTVGQLLTRTGANTGTFSNDGIQRTFTRSGTTLFDFTTTATGINITATGFGRAGRTISGGTLTVVNNKASTTCVYSPGTRAPITWTAGCSCPTSGTMSASCTGGKTAEITFTSECGTSTVVADGVTETVVMDRCYVP